MSDLISRQAAIDAVMELFKRVPTNAIRAKEVIEKLPSAQPKHGRWIDKYGDGDWHCSSCGAIVEKHEQDWKNWYFCYHCGAKMDEVLHETD